MFSYRQKKRMIIKSITFYQGPLDWNFIPLPLV